jgi:type IV fimbrial biogenesis protein FimT
LLGNKEGWLVLKAFQHAGFTLIELLITLVILGILLAVGLPSFSTWTQNAQIRTAAEAIQNGLQLARAEAVRRNTLVRFQLTSSIDDGCIISTTGNNWLISLDDPTSACGHALLNEEHPVSDTTNNPAPRIVQLRPAAEAGGRVTVSADNAVAVFNGFGRLAPIAPSTTPLPLSINIDDVGGLGTFRSLRVTVSVGGQVRMCDPALAAGDPQSC